MICLSCVVWCAIVSYIILGLCVCVFYCFFFFKQKTAYEMRISDWSSDVCSSDLAAGPDSPWRAHRRGGHEPAEPGRPGGGRGPRCPDRGPRGEIGRASCRESVCQYV